MKILWEKEKMLLTSVFSFSHNISYPVLKAEILHLTAFSLSSANTRYFEFGPVQNIVVLERVDPLSHNATF